MIRTTEAVLKIPEKATNLCRGDGFLDGTGVQRGLQGVSHSSLSPTGRAIGFNSAAASPGLLGCPRSEAAWQPVTVTVSASFRGGGKSMECCLAALLFRETSHKGAAWFEMAPYLAWVTQTPNLHL